MRVLLPKMLFAVGVLTSMSSPAPGGAFLFPEGQGQVILTTTFADASKAYDASGRLISTPSYRKFEAKAYVEYGATDWLTLVGEASGMDFRGASSSRPDYLNLLIAQAKARAPLSLTAPEGPHYHYMGLGLGAIGARVRLFELGNYVISLEASLRAASPSARRFLDMKDQWQADARLQIGRPIEIFGVPGFLDGQIGYRSRGQAGDEIRADVTCGLRPFDRWLLLAQSFSAITPGAPAALFVASQKFQLSAVFDVTRNLSLQLGGVAALSGANSPAERGLVSAVWYRF
jgi:hypothetical protein